MTETSSAVWRSWSAISKTSSKEPHFLGTMGIAFSHHNPTCNSSPAWTLVLPPSALILDYGQEEARLPCLVLRERLLCWFISWEVGHRAMLLAGIPTV